MVPGRRQARMVVSFGIWDNAEAVHAWKSSPEFRERGAHVLQPIRGLRPAELHMFATGVDGTSTLTVPARPGAK